MEVLEEENITIPEPVKVRSLKIDKARPSIKLPSSKNVSICAHRDELVNRPGVAGAVL